VTRRGFEASAILLILAISPGAARAGMTVVTKGPGETPALGFAADYVPCEGAASQPGTVRALLMGVDFTGSGPRLRGTTNDVRLIQRALTRRSSVAQVLTLINPDASAMAAGLRRLVEATRCRDFVVIHFSGRGETYRSEELGREDVMLVAQNGGRSRNALRGKDIAAAVLAMRNRGAFVMVAIDACFAGRLRLTETSVEPVWRLGNGAGERSATRLLPGAGGMAVLLAPDTALERQFGSEHYGAVSFAFATGIDSGAGTIRQLAAVIDSAFATSSEHPSFESTEPDRPLLVAGTPQAAPGPESEVAIKLLQPQPTKGQTLIAGVEIEVKAEAPRADRLVSASVNEATAQVDGRRLTARIRLTPGRPYITISATDTKSQRHTGSFQVVVNEDRPGPLPGRSVAILIANAHYQDAKRWQPLLFPETEIRDMQKTLQDSYGFEATSLKDNDGKEISLVLVDQDKDTILDTMETVANLLGPNDQLLVYYSGHGWKPPDMSEAFWVPYNATGKALRKYISSDEISKTFALSSVGHWLVISDSCRSGCMWGRCAPGAMKAPVPSGPQENDPGYYKGVGQINSRTPSRNAFTSGADEDVPSGRIFNSWLLKLLKRPPKLAFTGSHLNNWIQPQLAGDGQPGAMGQVSVYFVIPTSGGDKGGDFAFFHSEYKK
jgi:Caspase domain